VLRRTGLGLAAATVLGTGVLGFRAHDQGVFEVGEGPAYAPWNTWQDDDGLLRLVRAAVLAPSPHNAQAWSFSLAADHIDVFADHTRRTGAIDPFDRELQIGVGAAMENLVLAARANGWSPNVELGPRDDVEHLARIVLTRSRPRVSPLYHQIPRRHTNRFPFVRDRSVEQEALEAMAALALPGTEVIWITERRARHDFGALLVDATRAIIDDADQRRSDHAWFRHDWDELQRRRDGITLDGAGLDSLTLLAAKLLPAQSPTQLGEAWLDATADRHTATAAAYGLVAVDDPTDPEARIRAGRTLQRVHLWATGAGLALHHMNQVSERADRESQLHLPGPFGPALADLSPDGASVLCSFRLGHPTQTPGPSPRRSVEQVVR